MDKIKTIIVHHSGDNDGLMSGTIAYQMYKSEIKNGTVVLYGYDYQDRAKWMDDVESLLADDYTLYLQFIDITPSVEWLTSVKDYIADSFLKIQIFDHHEMRYNDIMDLKLPYIDYHFSTAWCGSKIYLDYWKEILGGNLLNNKNCSKVFASLVDEYETYVDAWDTWKFVNMRSKEHDILAFNETFGTVHDVESFNNLIHKRSIVSILRQGYYIIDFIIRNNLVSMFRNAMISTCELQGIKEVTNYPLLLIQGKPSYYAECFLKNAVNDTQFVVLYYNYDFKNNSVNVSIRNSVKGTFDCAELARKFVSNGGGHRDAAGCTMTVDDFNKLINVGIIESQKVESQKILEKLPVSGFDSEIIQGMLMYKNLNDMLVQNLD